MSETKVVECKFCDEDLVIDVEWAKKNGRVFCGNCGKSFDIVIEKEETVNKDSFNDGYYSGF